MSKKVFSFIALTVIFFLISHYIILFSHEWTHGSLAYLFGYKPNPFCIQYGINSWTDIFLFPKIDEAVQYSYLYFIGHPYEAGIIAITPPLLVNGGQYLICMYLLSRPWIQKSHWTFYFIFWLAIMALGNWYDYIPIRAFAYTGDVGNFNHTFGISPWWIYIIGTYIVIFFLWHFLKIQLPRLFRIMGIKNNFSRVLLLFIVLSTIFFLFGGTGLNNNSICQIMSWSSISLIPILMFALSPRFLLRKDSHQNNL